MAKQPKDVQGDLDKQYSLNFSKRELLVMFNELVRTDHKVGDGYVLFMALRKIEAIIAVDTNIPERQEEPNGVILKN